jgi:MFS family permease
MNRRQLSGLILAGALVTLDGTSTTIALPAIGHALALSVSRLQWIANAPLLMLAAMLLPAGTIADRYGRVRVVRSGLIIFGLGSLACVIAPSAFVMIGAKLAQGVGGALMLPSVLAVLRSAYEDAAERTRVIGVWAAWTGAAAAGGPLAAGALIDMASWRAVFVPSVIAAGCAWVLLRNAGERQDLRGETIPIKATVALMMLLGSIVFVVMTVTTAGPSMRSVVPALVIAAAGAVVLIRDRRRRVLLPDELVRARNCLPANATSFALYFGMFGVTFLLALYVQQLLGYSASWTAVVLLPLSAMLLMAEWFSRLTSAFGTRAVLFTGVVAAAAGVAWIGAGPHPAPFWSHLIAGTSLFGFGLSLSVSALTHAAVAAVPDSCAGAASALNHAVVRAAGLAAVALLGSIAAPGVSEHLSPEGFRHALIVCAAIVGVGGLAGSAALRDEAQGGVQASG